MRVAAVGCGAAAQGPVVDGVDGLTLIHDLCARPGRLSEQEGADRLVLVLHDGDYVPAQIQKHTRKMGVDPVGVQIIRWEEVASDPRRLEVLLAGATARAAALVDAAPEQAKLVLPGALNRRGVLSVPRPVYVPVPAIDAALCAADDGCKACVAECPQDAYEWIEGSISYDKEACVSCGRCVTICPRGAIANPTVNPAAVHESIAAMIGASSDPIGIAFVCSRRTRTEGEAGFYPVEVPCASMVPGTWPVAALMLGARAATIVPCGVSGCSLAFDDVVGHNVGFARALLEAAGIDADLVPVDAGTSSTTRSLVVTPVNDPFGVHGPHATIRALAAVLDGEIRIQHPGSPLGVVDVEPDACTMCMMCASVCPAGALGDARDGDELVLTFDAAACTACDQCVATCPEVERGAIVVRRAVDTEALRNGRVVVNRAGTERCEVCGAPVAPAPMLDRIASILGAEHAATMSYLKRRCLNCRGS